MVLTKTESRYLGLTGFYFDAAVITFINILIIVFGSSLSQTLSVFTTSPLNAVVKSGPSSHLPDTDVDQFWISACTSSTATEQAGEKWPQMALSTAQQSTSISAFSGCLHPLVHMFNSLLKCSVAPLSVGGIHRRGRQCPFANKHVCICTHRRSIHPATHCSALPLCFGTVLLQS